MQITDEIFDLLRQDYQLRKKISDKIGNRIVNIERWCDRKSIPNWYQKETMIIVRKHLKNK